MRRAIAVGLMLALCGSALAQRGRRHVTFDDQVIDEAIKKGVAYLWQTRQGDTWGPYGNDAERYVLGPTALAVYALLESDVSAQDPRLAKSIEWMKKTAADHLKASDNPPAAGENPHYAKTYEMGLLCNVYNSANRSTGDKFYGDLNKTAEVVWKYSNQGGYSYDIVKPRDPKNIPHSYDNSNTQYGLLAVWAAALANVEVPKEYWWLAMKHWQDTQCQDGGWTYNDIAMESRATMTAAGVASMFVCFDNLFTKGFLECNTQKEFEPIKRGLDWFDKNFESTVGGGGGWAGGYYLYGIERVGLASGYKYFGTSDWYKMGAKSVLAGQSENGSWSNNVVDTSFMLLFLIRGRHAVMFNKIDHPADWNNRPRDLAMETRWLTRKLERTVNWQIINLKVPVSEWHDAPILYMAGSKEPKFTPEEIQNLKLFVLQGGTILAVTECGGAGFTTGIKNLCAKMFPQYELSPVPPAHELNNCYYNLQGKAKFNMVSNGCRALLIHTDTDLSKFWQQQLWSSETWAFEAGANVCIYVTDKLEALRPRGTTLWPEATKEAPLQTIKIVRLDHTGNADPEPLAYERFKLLMGNLCKVKLDVEGPVAVSKLPTADTKVAVMTGTGSFTLTKEDKEALQKFVEGGGTLIIDAAGGSKAFAQAAQEALGEMYGVDAMRPLVLSAAVFNLKGLEIDKIRYRRKSRDKLGKNPNIRAILVNGRPAVIFSAEDLTAGLVGYGSYAIDGYDPGDASADPGTAFKIMRNLVLHAAQGPNATTNPAPATSSAPATPAPAEAGN